MMQNVKKFGGMVLAGVLTLGMGIGSVVGINSLLHKDDVSIGSVAEVKNEAGGSMIANNVNGTLMSLNIVRAMAETGIDGQALADTYTVTATVEPASATYKAVTYSVAWKNPNSTWARGKSVADYVTVAQATDGAATATLTCKKAFGEQVMLTCTSRDNANATATTTIEYIKKVTGVNLTPSTQAIGKNYTVTATPVFSDGTVQGDFKVQTGYITLNNSFLSVWGNEVDIDLSNFGNLDDVEGTISTANNSATFTVNIPDFYASNELSVIEMDDELASAFARAASKNTGDAKVTISYKYIYNGTTDYGTKVMNAEFITSDFSSGVTDVKLPTGPVYFGGGTV